MVAVGVGASVRAAIAVAVNARIVGLRARAVLVAAIIGSFFAIIVAHASAVSTGTGSVASPVRTGAGGILVRTGWGRLDGLVGSGDGMLLEGLGGFPDNSTEGVACMVGFVMGLSLASERTDSDIHKRGATAAKKRKTIVSAAKVTKPPKKSLMALERGFMLINPGVFPLMFYIMSYYI